MDSNESIEVVYTCGMCETILEDWRHHMCIEGYNNIYIDDNHYFYPVTDDGTSIIRRSLVNDGIEAYVEDDIPSQKGKENDCPNQPESSHSSKKPVPPPFVKPSSDRRSGKLDDTEVERLIHEVEKRVPLWNFSIPIEQRSRETISKLWEEVSVAINGLLSATDARKKFKALRDVYRRLIQAEQCPSGSGRATQKEKWKFYDLMEFLRDTCLIRPTSSNVSRPNNDDDAYVDRDESVDELINVEDSEVSGITQSKKRRRSSAHENESINILNRIADAMSREEPVPVLPPPPKMDDVDSFFASIAPHVRQMSSSDRLDIMAEILDLVRQKRRQCTGDN